MTEITLHLKKKISPSTVEKACTSLGLGLTMKGSLKSIPENIHWHYKKGREKEVLEITLLIQTNKVVFTCKNNRGGDWVEDAIRELKSKLN